MEKRKDEIELQEIDTKFKTGLINPFHGRFISTDPPNYNVCVSTLDTKADDKVDTKHGTETNTKVDASVQTEDDTETNTKVDTSVQTKDNCCTCCNCLKARAAPERKSTAAPKKEWQHRPNTEFPWRLEQLVDQEENWRGTWVLEVKDMGAMDWGITRVPKADGEGRGGRYQRQPTRQLPFPPGGYWHRETLETSEMLPGGQDDQWVMVRGQ
ncbi:hypothetical protein CPLU01_13327 [Colletotrichum plurivorum]|uniref:Uncharacterized protein n=1 Tax=Colletotrichum plurivorum TaxID=2175906 RepID=A0A8H6N3S1_9PEZI|nr:hypothetical protein CPLU01_13327 [Colletotrichum plurivorum]